ncbi:hypothetical protein GCM10007094_41110 [Pseudovibrio japonicus]|uniref:Uncharacterized protein n=1 Tax=Pseudovibrio japonicus TaxID=366534 RepID=A0ABQ3ERV9_9HYPH|nr:hypothetical protein [Pseudovibrio japonicus]GHB47597.1 hypothetical protein GCM10007094_41110 [Pseudovibrio japonicus]
MPVPTDSVVIGNAFSFHGQKVHIRGFVDDQVCYKVWRKTKRRWDYACEPLDIFSRFAEPSK